LRISDFEFKFAIRISKFEICILSFLVPFSSFLRWYKTLGLDRSEVKPLEKRASAKVKERGTRTENVTTLNVECATDFLTPRSSDVSRFDEGGSPSPFRGGRRSREGASRYSKEA